MKTNTVRFSVCAVVLMLGFGIVCGAHIASAHVVVTPAEVGAASWTSFKVGVPSEKAFGTFKVRLDIPEGLKHVTPNVKPGWTISTTKVGTGENMRISEITWVGGPIPAERRDEFYFTAQVPAEATTLTWKAYQSYADGSVVSWDAEPLTAEQAAATTTHGTPYSMTRVVDDLAVEETSEENGSFAASALALSIIALVTATIALRNSRSQAGK